MDDKRKPFVDLTAETNPPPSFLQATSQGAGPSRTPVAFQTRLACVSLHMTDRLRFINFSAAEISTLREALGLIWPIQETRRYGGAEEFKFRDYPWMGKAKGDDQSRRLAMRMLQVLHNMGWVLQAAVDISKSVSDKDSLVFRYQNPPPPPCDWLSISFDWVDKMKIVNTPPSDLTEALVAEFNSNYRLKSHELEKDRLKLKFHGHPWQAGSEQTVKLRMMLLKLLEVLERFGYSLYANVSETYGSEADADVLVVTRRKDWAPGMPIWHR